LWRRGKVKRRKGDFNMDYKFIIGIVVTITVGIPAFIALQKERKTKLVFIQESLINLYHSVVKRFDEMTIKYKGNDIKENMFLLKGIIFCSGRKDITKDEITKSINFKTEEGAIWHDCKIISTTTDLQVENIISGNEIRFDFPLLKNKDYIYFEALGESKKSTYKISHRIANIESIEINHPSSLKFDRSYTIWSGISSFIFAVFFIISIPGSADELLDIVYVDSKGIESSTISEADYKRYGLHSTAYVVDTLIGNQGFYDFIPSVSYKLGNNKYEISASYYLILPLTTFLGLMYFCTVFIGSYLRFRKGKHIYTEFARIVELKK
jgi:uncharacterized protein (UPF0333 family)